MDLLLKPSAEPYWKLVDSGANQDIFFITTLDQVSGFVVDMHGMAGQFGYPADKIGVYVQPVHQGASCHCEFNLPFDPNNPEKTALVRKYFNEASHKLIEQGAFFSRPHGIWADMVFSRDLQTTKVLRKVKTIFDPNNIMNPGKLCFK